MHDIFIDLETYSAVPIAKAGAAKYCRSDSFQILLFAYSVDGGPVRVIDMAMGEEIPPWLVDALTSPEYIKHAYNAAFEWNCLSRYLRTFLPAEQWRDTMLSAQYCGLPGSLDAVGKALGLPQEKAKLSVGKALIRYFCVPCEPTEKNGHRTRNLPEHAPDRWELFKEYNRRDVEAEMEIEHRLKNFPVPDFVQKQWETDLLIGSRGVTADMELVNGALEIDRITREKLLREAAEITGLANPNSVAQLTAWLSAEMDDCPDNLRKETVSDLLKSGLDSRKAERMLEIRQELGKTSTKKYQAIADAICEDGRVRGLLQFYGANRSGRWAGRLVQVQNLPKTYLEAPDLARELVKQKNAEMLNLIYGSVPDTLSQLIRTALTASEGATLIDADFSAIEARVISWLAGEQWRLEVFRTHGKIYEASASQMFGVPMDRIRKGNPEYALRAKGKVAELALGYQGYTGALINMGALKMGLSEDELPDIANRWRDSNKQIVNLWYAMESAAIQTIRTGTQTGVKGIIFSREYDRQNNLDFLTLRLPSGRKLFYASPQLTRNTKGRDTITYAGMHQSSHHWIRLETYGGKLVENTVQAIARDCLAEAIERLETAGFPIMFHIHDEVVIDYYTVDRSPEEALQNVIEIMRQPPAWAPDLPLNADGWTGKYFRKD